MLAGKSALPVFQTPKIFGDLGFLLMNWKRELQLNDIEAEQVLEFTCKICNSVYYKKAAEVQECVELRFLWLDEIESNAVCYQRLCYGNIRLAVMHENGASGFVAGLA